MNNNPLNIPPKPQAGMQDNVNAPKHYQSPNPIIVLQKDLESGKSEKVAFHIQALDVIKAWGLTKDAYLFNVIKYVLRSGKKGDDKQYLEDLAKSRFYLNEKIKELAEELGVPVPQSHNH